MTRAARGASAAALALLVLAACGDGGVGQGDGSAAELPVSAPSGEIDERLAERGKELFRTRGCVSCHTIGEGRRVGPDLAGVTGRREFAWTYHMVVNPDSMLQNDTTAQRLLEEFFTPMADQNVTPEQFRAIYEYLREEDAEREG